MYHNKLTTVYLYHIYTYIIRWSTEPLTTFVTPTRNVSHFRHDYKFFRVQWPIYISLERRSSYEYSYSKNPDILAFGSKTFVRTSGNPVLPEADYSTKYQIFPRCRCLITTGPIQRFETLFFRLLLRIHSMSSRFLSPSEWFCPSEERYNSLYMPRSWGTENYRNCSAAYSDYMATVTETFL